MQNQPAFMSLSCMLTAPTKLPICFMSLCWALTAFVQHVTAFTGLCGMLSAFAKLWDANRICRNSTTLHNLRAANSSYQTLNFIHKPSIVLTVVAEPLPEFTSLCGKLTAPTKSLAGFTTLCGKLIALEEPLAVFINLSGMLAAYIEPLPTLRTSWGH